jgi:hypothetical protein
MLKHTNARVEPGRMAGGNTPVDNNAGGKLPAANFILRPTQLLQRDEES